MCVLFQGIELCHIFIEFCCYVYVVVLSCHGVATQLQLTNISYHIILMTRHGHVAHLDLSVLLPGPASLLATYKRCVFFRAVFTYVVIQEINVIRLEQTLMVTIRIQSFVVYFGLPNGTFWRILKGDGDRVPRRFRPFWTKYDRYWNFCIVWKVSYLFYCFMQSFVIMGCLNMEELNACFQIVPKLWRNNKGDLYFTRA